MKKINVQKIKSPWNITIYLNNGFGKDIEIHFERVVLRECDIPFWVSDWVVDHLKYTRDVRLSYSIVNSNYDRFIY